MLVAHGDVIGVDSGRPEVPEGFEAHVESDGVDLLDRAGSRGQEPGRAAR